MVTELTFPRLAALQERSADPQGQAKQQPAHVGIGISQTTDRGSPGVGVAQSAASGTFAFSQMRLMAIDDREVIYIGLRFSRFSLRVLYLTKPLMAAKS